jgi:MFS transporter, DHA1 family, multidrug resistance protein
MTAATSPSPHPGMGFKQFTALVALMMALNAVAIDSMLPALPAIGQTLGVHLDNQRQLIITVYMLGFGAAQLFYGVLGDRFGRRPVLLAAIAFYVAATAAAAFAPTFEVMLAARVVQGAGAAATRVLCIAIVRDCYAGRTMAKVMSLVFIVFLAAPMVAPAMGQLVLAVAHWRWIFGVLGVFGAIILAWAGLKLPETLRAEDRLPIKLGRIAGAFRTTLTTRQSIGYTLAMTVGFGGLMSFIVSAQQIFFDIFDAANIFPLVFALIAVAMGISSFTNSRIVEKYGMRRVSHVALLCYIGVNLIHVAVVLMGVESIWTFSILQAGSMLFFGMMGSNFGALAMEPMGQIAGVASSVQGTISTIGAAIFGYFVGQQFNGSTTPFAIGVLISGLLALIIILVVEKGRLFHGGAPMDAHKTPAA